MSTAIADERPTIRAAGPDDFAFVWETSLKVRKPHGVTWRDWSAALGDVMARELNAPGSSVRIMDGGGVIVGFAHDLGGVLQMLYVKRDLRGFGFGVELVAPLTVDGAVAVHRPNACWRKWSALKALRWVEK